MCGCVDMYLGVCGTMDMSLYIYIYIYPIITNRYEVYNVRSISHNDGKLLIDNHVAKCINRYYVISNFKTEINNNYGTLGPESTCFTRLLNGEKTFLKILGNIIQKLM